MILYLLKIYEKIIKIKINVYLITLFFQEVKFQGAFDVLLARTIVSNLLFGKCSIFHISNIVRDIIPHLGTFVRKALFCYP